MPMFNILDASSSAMHAQTVRLNTVASNLSNADSISSTAEGAYKPKHPVFAALLSDASNKHSAAGVTVSGIVESEAPPIVRYEPNHPLADEQGNIYSPNINTIEEMTNMMSASRSYQNNVEVFNTTKQLLLATLNMGR
ncbi:flagellar basal body rod protein FlgC [Pseudomonadota bacterium]